MDWPSRVKQSIRVLSALSSNRCLTRSYTRILMLAGVCVCVMIYELCIDASGIIHHWRLADCCVCTRVSIGFGGRVCVIS